MSSVLIRSQLQMQMCLSLFHWCYYYKSPTRSIDPHLISSMFLRDEIKMSNSIHILSGVYEHLCKVFIEMQCVRVCQQKADCKENSCEVASLEYARQMSPGVFNYPGAPLGNLVLFFSSLYQFSLHCGCIHRQAPCFMGLFWSCAEAPLAAGSPKMLRIFLHLFLYTNGFIYCFFYIQFSLCLSLIAQQCNCVNGVCDCEWR